MAKEANDMPAEFRRHLSLAQHSTHALHSLVDDILDLSKIESGKIEINACQYNLPKSLQDAVTPFIFSANEKSIQLNLTYHALPECIHADETHIRQILLNLIGNAIKFTDQGYVNINASIVMLNGQEQLSIAIQDSGIDINAQKIPMLFEPFVQLSQDADRKGTGLGTTIAKRFAVAMGGDIQVSSQLGKGSTFTITVPVQSITEKRISQQVDSHQTPDMPKLESIKPVQDIRVLLAEDDDISRMLAINSLTEAGFTVEIATHGLEAWEKIQAKDFDLLLTDIRMPSLNGIELTHHIRNYEKNSQHHTRIIGISAHAIEDVAQECLAAGMDDFIAKPIHPDALLRKLV